MTAKERSFVAYNEAGLHPYHHAILAVLDEGSRRPRAQSPTPSATTRASSSGSSTSSRTAGLIERRRDPADRRRQLVRMTAAGRKTLERLRRLSSQLEDDFLASLSDDERAQLHTLLLRLAEQHLPNCRQA